MAVDALKGFDGTQRRPIDPGTEMNGRDQLLAAYSVFHVKRNAPEEILVDVVSAADEAGARRMAERLFGNITILHVHKNDLAPENGMAPSPEKTQHPNDRAGFPSARFINGKFHAAGYPALQNLDE